MIELFLDLLLTFSYNLTIRYKETRTRDIDPGDYKVWENLTKTKLEYLIPIHWSLLGNGSTALTTIQQIKVPNLPASVVNSRFPRYAGATSIAAMF